MKIKIIQLLLFISITNFSAQANFSNFSNFDNDFTDYENLGSKDKSGAILFEDFDGKEHKIITDFELSPNINIQKLPVFAKDKSNYCLAITDANYTGYLYEYNITTKTLEKEILYQNEPTWTRTFFGKTQNGNPVLYHIDNETNFIYQSYKKDGKWKLHRTFPLTDSQLDSLFSEQSIRSSSENPNVFDIDMNIKDSYFKFLEWKAELEGNPKYYKQGAIHYPKNGEDGPFYIPECWKTQKTTESDVIEIQNMPPVKTQNTMGECRAFSLAVLIQKFICENSKNADGSKRYIDCSNPPPDKAISYFGMMAYTNSVNSNLKTLITNVEYGSTTDSVIYRIEDAGDGFIFENCKPFDEMAAKFSMYNDNGDKKAEDFLNYTKELYQQRSKPNIKQVENCDVCLEKLSKMTGFEKNQINLQKALSKKTHDEFLFTLLFDDCKFRDVSRGFQQIRYPQSYENVSNNDLKAKIIEGLKKGNPVLFPNLHMKKYDEIHSIVISGYKKIYCDSKYIDAFKIHNSWGIEWQKLNNDGWVSADILINNIYRDNGIVQRGSVIWLE
ncbi:MAG: hypothetical protein BGO86_15915 [Chryseobacterium sp. 36-9]|nr:MAG: hypothetical protein BGO86_15915 [Chryseobacterium sp. 36-9]